MSIKNEKNTSQSFSMGKQNYFLLIAAFVIIVLGFALMSGGKSDDPNVFNPEVFSFQRITLAPILVVAGFIGVIYAILKKPKD